MNIISQSPTTMLIRFDKNEEVVSGMITFSNEQAITAASFTAIGACKELHIAYYNLDKKTYEDHVFQEDLEITGIIGNIGRMDHTIVIHAHGTFGRKDMSIIGGHIKKLVVSATCEIVIILLEGEIIREYDEDTGLNLIKNAG